MVIKASSSKQIDTLVKGLSSDSAGVRDAAVARLTVIGGRAVERLAALAKDEAARSATRQAALRALEAIADPHAVEAALRALEDDDVSIAAAGIGLARLFLRGPRGVALVDRLTALALDAGRPLPVRKAALSALLTLEPPTITPLLRALASDDNAEIAALANPRRGVRSGDATLPRQLEGIDAGRLPDDPDAVRHAMPALSKHLTLALLHQLIEKIRERETLEVGPRRGQWQAARAAVHAALAGRGSRLAVYDLRESLESAAAPLPVEMLTALGAVGDRTCLEPIAGAYARINDNWWRRHLIDAFEDIMKRERLTGRHAAIARIRKRWPEAAEHLCP